MRKVVQTAKSIKIFPSIFSVLEQIFCSPSNYSSLYMLLLLGLLSPRRLGALLCCDFAFTRRTSGHYLGRKFLILPVTFIISQPSPTPPPPNPQIFYFSLDIIRLIYLEIRRFMSPPPVRGHISVSCYLSIVSLSDLPYMRAKQTLDVLQYCVQFCVSCV
jgi:hypothetical protein